MQTEHQLCCIPRIPGALPPPPAGRMAALTNNGVHSGRPGLRGWTVDPEGEYGCKHTRLTNICQSVPEHGGISTAGAGTSAKYQLTFGLSRHSDDFQLSLSQHLRVVFMESMRSRLPNKVPNCSEVVIVTYIFVDRSERNIKPRMKPKHQYIPYSFTNQSINEQDDVHK